MASILNRAKDRQQLLDELNLTSVTRVEDAVISASINRAEAAVKKHLRYDPVKRTRTEYYPRLDLAYSSTREVWEATDNTAYLRRTSTGSTDELQVQHLPIRSDVNIRVWIDYDGRSGAKSGAFGNDSEKTLGTDFWPNYDGQDDDGNGICRDGIIKSLGLWPLEPGSIKVRYSAGYSAEELDGEKSLVDAVCIYEACMVEALRRAKKAFVNKRSKLAGFLPGPVTSENLGDYSYSVDSSVASKLFGNTTGLIPETISLLSDFVNKGIELGG